MAPPKKQFCPNGHDTFIVGRYSTGTCKACIKNYSHKWYAENAERMKQHRRTKYATNKSNLMDAHRTYNQGLLDEFFEAYGSTCQGPTGTNDCVHGGVSDRDLLTIAHLWGDGKEHRDAVGNRSTAMSLLDLKRRGWPKDIGIGVQCHNCQRKHTLIMLDFSRQVNIAVSSACEEIGMWSN